MGGYEGAFGVEICPGRALSGHSQGMYKVPGVGLDFGYTSWHRTEYKEQESGFKIALREARRTLLNTLAE